jgi:flagellar hook-associated protein 2
VNLVAKLREAGLNASFDTTHGRFFISSKASGKNNAFTITQSNETVDGSLSSLGLGVIDQDRDGNIVSSNSKVALVQASDAEIVYNNAVLTSDSNNFTVNGLNIVAKEITAENEVLKINVTKDTEAVYNTIKDFVKTYNELITEMNSAYYADSARGYDPLTDDEKAQMTDKQIEQWEDKIKTSLLRRDNTLSKVITSMRNELGKSLDLDGEKYSLASLGIVTGNYQEKGLLHIEGDSDYSTVAIKENKLMKALSEDPDLVMKVFNKLTGDLYETMSEQMKSTELSSALTFYNDKAMKEKVTDYKKELAKLENRLLDIEERYYKQFSAMETAMQKMNSQSNYLASMLGTGTY